ncbi:MAG: hypothetical protein KC417_15220, partial [Myxococcales bacterium]|nr:hypothetical protein [Myxococcales bacterium]
LLWQRGEPWTSVAVRRMGGEIDWIAGPDLISRWTGPLGGDWRRDHRVIAAAVARNMAPVHVGLFSEEHIVRDLLRTPDAGRWARAAAVRDIAFYPTPAYVGVALGADVVRSATRQAASFLGGLKLFESIAPIAAELRSRVTDVASVSAALGFNPLEALGRFLRGEDRSSLPASTLPAPEESGADNGENGQ